MASKLVEPSIAARIVRTRRASWLCTIADERAANARMNGSYMVRRENRRSAAARAALAGRLKPRFLSTHAGRNGRDTLQFKWADAVSEQEWAVYSRAMETLRAAGVDFMLGGGFALAAFTGRWRDTKDIDFY